MPLKNTIQDTFLLLNCSSDWDKFIKIYQKFKINFSSFHIAFGSNLITVLKP